jgi:hypothetical protein
VDGIVRRNYGPVTDFGVDLTRIRELTVRHGLKMTIGARLTWDDGSCEATTIPVERTPIR